MGVGGAAFLTLHQHCCFSRCSLPIPPASPPDLSGLQVTSMPCLTPMTPWPSTVTHLDTESSHQELALPCQHPVGCCQQAWPRKLEAREAWG